MIGSARPAGYTLLEVLLSLVLISLVLLCLSMAVDFQMRLAEVGRTHVEEAQLARILLHRMADDLRGAVPTNPMAESQAAGAAAPSQSGTETETPEPEDPEEETPTEETAETEEAVGTVDMETTLVEHTAPGVYGGTDWIAVDVSRLPRIDQFETLVVAGAELAGSGDVKTVAYYVAEADESATISLDDEAGAGGLMRRELDRAVTSWASAQGMLEDMGLGERLMAPEVVAVQFRYSDGLDWLDDWDTAGNGGLPVAVEITLILRPVGSKANWATDLAASAGGLSTEEEELVTYSLVVDLPAAQAAPGSATALETEGMGTPTDEAAPVMEPES